MYPQQQLQQQHPAPHIPRLNLSKLPATSPSSFLYSSCQQQQQHTSPPPPYPHPYPQLTSGGVVGSSNYQHTTVCYNQSPSPYSSASPPAGNSPLPSSPPASAPPTTPPSLSESFPPVTGGRVVQT
eukprot:GHVS01094705.1.p1 GENE.GHVS01094705.1~~GHVS01094705.1.p1  ORF type:complete len:143 (+),score=49.55 GHVS01094705.1:52-429(+)